MRILVVNVNWLGDILFSTPALRAIKKKHPNAYLACLVPPWGRVVLQNNPAVDELISFEENSFFTTIWQTKSLIGLLRKRGFDTAIFFHRSKTKALAACLSGIRRRVGYRYGFRDFLLTEGHSFPEGRIHRIDFFLHLLRKSGVEANGRTLDFFPRQEAEEELRTLLGRQGAGLNAPYAVVHAGGNWPLKRWPVSYFVEWLRLFFDRFGWKIFLCGTTKEQPIAKSISSYFPNEARLISLCGKTSLDTLAILLRGAQFLLTNDSGPMHLAASQGTNIIGLFGPTSPEITGPVSKGPAVVLRKDTGCEVPCYFRSCDYRVCMDWITPHEVFQKSVEMVEGKGLL
ncbi:MAG: lipopolysaccharide heptosyltransferase II [Candidatus Omnitrophica bacterium]|nr:lipopolysaccharide heptosyltransferase II [Candidatus Omnitrophota bacterium]